MDSKLGPRPGVQIPTVSLRWKTIHIASMTLTVCATIWSRGVVEEYYGRSGGLLKEEEKEEATEDK